MNSDLQGNLTTFAHRHYEIKDGSPKKLIDHRMEQIQKILNFLRVNFIKSDQSNHRKGGLMGLAGVIMGLTTKRNELTYEGIQFLSQVIPIIDQCLDDSDSSVRYYACETLYNVMKVARFKIISYFDIIFSKIQKLCDDSEINVRNANLTVNYLLQDIVCSYDEFDILTFINKLEKLIINPSTNIRILTIEWLIALDSEPDIYLLKHIPKFLNYLFMSLVDGIWPKVQNMVQKSRNTYVQVQNKKSQKLRTSSKRLMDDLLNEILQYLSKDKLHFEEEFNINHIVKQLVDIILSNDTKIFYLFWLKNVKY